MSRALLVIDVQNEYFTGALPITHPAGHLERAGFVLTRRPPARAPSALVATVRGIAGRQPPSAAVRTSYWPSTRSSLRPALCAGPCGGFNASEAFWPRVSTCSPARSAGPS